MVEVRSGTAVGSERVLQVTGLDVHFGAGLHRTRVIRGADLVVERGEAVGLVGETGSGKTTLARAILGLVTPTSGTIVLGDVEVQRLRAGELRDLRRSGVMSYVFQDPLRSLDPDRTIVQSVGEPLEIRGGSTRAQRRSRAAELLERVDLGEWVLDRHPHEISGGQRQRAAIARALITDPQLIILDEPVSALDAPNRARVLQILSDLRSSGMSMIFISHDLGSVAGLADRLVVLYRGEVKEQGAAAEVIRNPQHPYTRLLVGSAPRMFSRPLSREERAELREMVAQATHS